MNMPRALVVRTAGTNCDQEMARGFQLAGASAELLHLDAIVRDPSCLERFDLIGFAGGFSYGDDCGAGRVQAVKIREHLVGPLREAAARGVPMIGACNGFQVLVQTGLLPGLSGAGGGVGWEPSQQTVALANNAGGRFIDEWVEVEFEPRSVCVWTKGLSGARIGGRSMMLPIAHGEGRFVAASPEVLRELEAGGQVVLRYGRDVNGSMGRVAGICDATGRVFGLMPHPERYLSWHNHPFWTSLSDDERSDRTLGLRIFQSAVESVCAAPAAA